MIRNYIKTIGRNVTRNASFAFINVVGLALGMASCFIIALYVRFESSFDMFHEKGEAIYRYIPRSSSQGELAMQTYTPAGLAAYYANAFPELKAWTRYAVQNDRPALKIGNKILAPEPIAMADSSFFSMFTFPLTRGESGRVLARPSTVVISESIAERFFADEDPVGKVIDYNGKLPLEITGVFKNVPSNSHFAFSYVMSFTTLPVLMESFYQYKFDEVLQDMGAWNYSTYFYIPDGGTADLEKRLSLKLNEYYAKGNPPPPNMVHDWLQPMSDIHFTKGIKADDGGTGTRSHVYIFSGVAILILVIACFNFVNLSTALALRRAREVGLRKAIGASRRQLMIQFIGETAVLTSAGFLIALQLVELLLPFFNQLMGLGLSFSLWNDKVFLLTVLAIGVAATVFGGAYPAFYLSSFHPSRVLRGDYKTGRRGGLRKALIVSQFAIAAFLFVGTTIVFQQMAYMKKAHLGFDKENVIGFPVSVDVHRNFESFKERLLTHSGVRAVSLCGGIPGRSLSHWRYHFPDGEHPDVAINTVVMDYDYLDVIGLELADGRKISREYATDDSLSYLINETAAREFQLANPVGTSFMVKDGRHAPGKIVGVVKDYHFRSLHHKVDPLVLRIEKDNAWFAAVKLQAGAPEDKLAFIKKEWDRVSPDQVFDFAFLDDSYDKLYRAEEKTGMLLTVSAALAIFVACLGLLGLASFMIQQRRREISIRKVHGASIRDVVTLLSWDFVKLVLLGFLVMVPLGWYASQRWLENFAYKMTVHPLIFLAGGAAVLGFALLTVSYQSVRASRANPAKVLKEQ
jgi:putative ABC transport system permease protein